MLRESAGRTLPTRWHGTWSTRPCSRTAPVGPIAPGTNAIARAPRRSSGGVLPPIDSHGLLAATRSQPHGTVSRSPSPAGPHTPTWHGSARVKSAGRVWKRGRRGRRKTFSAASVPGRKPFAILPCQPPVFQPIFERRFRMAEDYPFRPGRFIILRSGRSCQPRQCLAVVPRHPLRWVSLQLLGVPQ